MFGVVSLLDEVHTRLVHDLWAELEAETRLSAGVMTPFPHFSYHVAEEYNRARLEAALRRVASKTAPFLIKTSGLGIFTGGQPVLYLPIVRTQRLSQFHRKLWREIDRTAVGSLNYYHPDHWMPHITISSSNVTPAVLAEAIRLLSEREFVWEIPMDNLALGYDDGTSQGIQLRVRLSETP
jgi:2'-5' RNA ligase